VKTSILAVLAVAQALGQTQIDLGRQAKNVDFSSLPFVRPFRTGTSLPGTCVTGEMFFLTAATAGSNAYGCTATNTWTAEGQNSAGSGGATVPLQVARSTSNSLQIGSNCSLTSVCNARMGGIVYSFSMPAVATVQSGSGLAYIYLDSNGALTVGTSTNTSPQVVCSGCHVLSQITQFPLDSLPLATWNTTSGTWDPAGTDERAILSAGKTFTAGTNIQITESGDNVTIAQITSNSQVTSGSGSATGSYNPLDMTEFDRTIVFGEFGWLTPAPYGYSAACIGTGMTAGAAGEVPAPNWLSYNNAPCVLSYPGTSGPHPFADFLSGNSPLAYTLKARFAGGTGNTPGPGNFYVGWSGANDGTFSNFVGLRYLASSNLWQCVISAGGTDVSATTMAGIPDTKLHTYTITNGTTPNTVTCQIDSATAANASGTIPGSSWFSVLGTNGVPLTTFTALEERIQILGISR
jgi:hypothetical protein